MLNGAIIGCGTIYRTHAEAILEIPDARLAGVCDVDETALAAATKHYGCAGYTDYKELLQAPDVDVVHICTPHFLHLPMAVQALQAGKHVLCEKPAAILPAQARQMAEAARQVGRTLGICFQNRYAPAYLHARQLLENGSLGRVKGARTMLTWLRSSAYYSQAAWRGTWQGEGGGVLINQAIHTLDLLCWLLGQPQSVSARVATHKLDAEIEVEDTAEAYIVFPDGVECVFLASNCFSSTPPPLIELDTEQGMLQVYSDEVLLRTRTETRALLPKQAPGGVGKACWGSGHSPLVADFYGCVHTGRAFPITADEGAKSLALIESIYRSSATGKTMYTEAGT